MQGTVARSVAIADSGELEDVRQILRELEIEYTQGFAKGDSGSLLISTPEYALAEDQDGAGLISDAWSFHIVVAEKVTRQMRQELKSGHCDFLVQRPAHLVALRLLIQCPGSLKIRK